MSERINVRHVLPAVRVPTLVLHRKDDRVVTVDEGRLLAAEIPGARYVELAGADHWPWNGDSDAIVEEVQEFVTGTRGRSVSDRVLSTVMFSDIVGSTQLVAELGDRRWGELIEAHHALVRKALADFHGREVDTAGDGFLATFDGPARGIRCACAIRDAVRGLGIQVRVGLHTGECERMGDKLGGIAVHIGARVASLAAPGEVLVTRTVRDLVAGSGLQFDERGSQALRGVPDQWQLFAVREPTPS
jgi:class 3 adenylate cyclase